MDKKKEDLCFECRTMLAAWHGALLNPETSARTKERIRRKLHQICDRLDEIEKQEGTL